MNFKKSKRKARNLLIKIDPNIKRKHITVKIKADHFAKRIIELSRRKLIKIQQEILKRNWKKWKWKQIWKQILRPIPLNLKFKQQYKEFKLVKQRATMKYIQNS